LKISLIQGDATKAEQNLWWVPLGLKSENHSIHAQNINIIEKQKYIDIRPLDLTFYKLNDSASGVYRVNYPASRLEKLGKQIASGHKMLNAPDRISLVADAAALAISGEGSTTGFLSLVENFKCESNFFVWDELLKRLAQLQSCWYEQPERVMNALRAFSMNLVSEKFAEIGWEAKSGENYLTNQLRPLLIKEAGFARIPGYTAERTLLIKVLKKKPVDVSRHGLLVMKLFCHPTFVASSLGSFSVRKKRQRKIMKRS
jgi:aminopeptidase N